MNKSWDNDISFRPETWAALARHLLPGAFGICFGSARGWHRLACAIEDAGLLIHPSIFMLGWCSAQGWPKATRIPDERFDGHRYGRQMLKPALEPLIVWQKPYQGKPVESITAAGAGALWIDGARIAGPEPHHNYGRPSGAHSFVGASTDGYVTPAAGRWPPNLVLLHDPACERLGVSLVTGDPRGDCQGTRPGGFGNVGAASGSAEPNARVYGDETVVAYQCVDACPVRQFDLQAGERTSGAFNGVRSGLGYAGAKGGVGERAYDTNTGPASRFFPCPDWSLNVAEQLTSAGAVFYAGKASTAEREQGLRHLPFQDAGEHAGRNLTNNSQFRIEQGRVTGPKADSSRKHNPHPTVKNLKLCEWLCRLLAPPAAYAPRRLLIPFAGVASEMIGAVLSQQWEDIVGIEQSPEYVALGQQRLAYWTTQIAAQLSLFPGGPR